MELTDWIKLSGDPTAEMRLSLILSCVLFQIVFAILWLIGSLIAKKVLANKADEFAKSLGFPNFNELRFDFVRYVVMSLSSFLVIVFFIYFMTHQLEIVNTYRLYTVVETDKQCMSKGGALVCVKMGYDQFNNSDFNWSVFKWWNSSSIIESSQTK